MSTASDLDTLANEHVDAEDGVVLTFQTKKFTLEALLSKAANVLPTRDILPALTNFLVEVTDSEIKVGATDSELSVIASSPLVSTGQPGSAIFPAKKFMEIVREAPAGDVLVEVSVESEKYTSTIRAGGASWFLRLMNSDSYPSLPNAEAVEFHEVDKEQFVSAIRHVRQAASSDSMRQHLMMVDIREGKMRASDGVRFQQVVLEFPLDVSIPINAVDDLVKVLALSESEHFFMAEDDNALLFRVGGDLFVAQKMNVDFPDMEDVLLKPALANDYHLHVDREELIAAIKRVRITSDDETNAIVLEISEDSLTVTSRDKKGSRSIETLAATWTGPKDQTLAFNHKHLLEMLRMWGEKSCDFSLGPYSRTRPSPLMLGSKDKQVGVLNQLRFVS